MPRPTDIANPQRPKKGFFTSLFARHRTPAASSKQTEAKPQGALPIAEAQPPRRHPLQDEIEEMLARLSETLDTASLGSAGRKERDVLRHQYRQALRTFHRGNSEDDPKTVEKVLTTILVRLQALAEETDAMKSIATGTKPSAEAANDDRGFAAKRLGDEYVGETATLGWRLQAPPNTPVARQVWELLKSTPVGTITEGRWDQTKRELHELRTDEDGLVYTRDGKNHLEYVVDEQGHTYMFSGEKTKRDLTGEELQQIRDALDTLDRLEVSDSNEDLPYLQKAKTHLQDAITSGKIAVHTHHSSPVGGDDIVGGGEMKRRDGKIVEISNVSGHYKPLFVQLAQTIEHLMRQGAMLDKTLVYLDQDGNARPIDENPEVKTLYAAVTQKLPELVNLRKEISDVNGRLGALQGEQLDEKQKRGAKVRLEQRLHETREKIRPMEEALHMLRKLGAGPANKTSDTRVVFLDNIQDKTGLEIHDEGKSSADKPTVEEFLTTGGGYRIYDKDAPKTAPNLKPYRQPEDGGPAKGAYTEKTVASAKSGVLSQIRQRRQEPLSNETPGSADMKRVLGALRPPTSHMSADGSGPTDENSPPPDLGQGYAISFDPNAATDKADLPFAYSGDAANRESVREVGASRLRMAMPATELGEGYQNQATGEGVRPGDDATPAYGALALDESGLVVEQGREDQLQARAQEGSSIHRDVGVPDLGEADQNQGMGDGVQPGSGVGNAHFEIGTDENVARGQGPFASRTVTAQGYTLNSGYVHTIAHSPHGNSEAASNQSNTSLASTTRDSRLRSNRTKKEETGFAMPGDFVQQVEQIYKRKVQRISGAGLNCYIRSILTGIWNEGWRPGLQQTLDSVIAEIAAALRIEGLRAPDGLIDAGGRDGARVRQLVKKKTGCDIGLRIITWDRTNARIASFDVTAGSLKITLVNTPGHFDLLV